MCMALLDEDEEYFMLVMCMVQKICDREKSDRSTNITALEAA